MSRIRVIRTILIVLILAVACDDRDRQRTLTAPQAVVSPADQVTVLDRTPRYQMAASVIVESLPQSADRLIVSVKERGAVRGVSVDGRTVLPRAAAQAAQERILSEIPGLELVTGTERVIRGFDSNLGTRVATSYSPFFVVSLRDLASEEAHKQVIDALLRHPHVDFVEPDWAEGAHFGTMEEPNRRELPETRESPILGDEDEISWGVSKVRAPSAWAQGFTGPESAIFVMIDSGMDYADAPPPNGVMHPDFGSKLGSKTEWIYDVTPPCDDWTVDPCALEQFYHGTGVLGAAIAADNGSHGMGVAHSTGNASGPVGSHGGLIVHRVTQIQETDTVLFQSDFAAAVDETISNVNGGHWIPVGVTSVGYRNTDITQFQTLQSAFQRAAAQNKTLWFSAAGNQNPLTGNDVAIPARFPEVVAVSMLKEFGLNVVVDEESAVGPQIELSAPGRDLFLPWNRLDDADGMRTVSGTSYAAPIAAGVALLVAEKFPTMSASELRTFLHEHALDLDEPDVRDINTGFGMVDAICALDELDCASEAFGGGGGGGGGGGESCEEEFPPECCGVGEGEEECDCQEYPEAPVCVPPAPLRLTPPDTSAISSKLLAPPVRLYPSIWKNRLSP